MSLQVRDVPWRNTLNCSCKARPPGTCSCVQYAECMGKVDDDMTLQSLGASSETLRVRNDYMKPPVGVGQFEYTTTWQFAEPRPMPVTYSFLQESGARDERGAAAALEAALDDSPSLLEEGASTTGGQEFSDDFKPYSRQSMVCHASKLLCNCSHTCACEGQIPDEHSTCPPAGSAPWPQPLRVDCGDAGLTMACGHSLTGNAFGQVSPQAQADLVVVMGAGLQERCIRQCTCATILLWGILWF
jgi:hypothetical protein